MRALAVILVVLATAAFAASLTLPIVSVERLYFWTDRPTILDLIATLWVDGDRGLAALIAAFSIVTPAVKLIALSLVLAGFGGSATVTLLSAIGKWSMMDVMLTAIVVYAARTSGLAEAVVEPGLVLYAAAVVAAMVATILAAPAARRLRRRGLALAAPAPLVIDARPGHGEERLARFEVVVRS